MKNARFFLIALGFVATGCAVKDSKSVKTAYIHRYDVEVSSRDDFYSRGATGEVVSTLRDGTVQRKNYVKGILEGKSSWTFPHSDTVYRVAQFKKGVLIEEQLNYAYGTPRQKNIFHKNGTHEVVCWYEDATPRSFETFKEGLLLEGRYYSHLYELESEVTQSSGVRTLRDDYGLLAAKETIADGVLTYKEKFHANGVPAEHAPYVNGEMHGIRKTFTVGGEPLTVEEWQYGVQHGTTCVYRNGEKIARVPYVQGQKHGVEELLRPSSEEVVGEITWVHGERHGPSHIYVESQQITDWYYSNRKVSKSEYSELASAETLF